MTYKIKWRDHAVKVDRVEQAEILYPVFGVPETIKRKDVIREFFNDLWDSLVDNVEGLI